MEITIIILGYILHCFTAFSLVFSCDEAKIWGKGKQPELRMPRLDDLQEEERLNFDKNDTKDEWERKERINDNIDYKNKQERREYVEKVIAPAHHYFILRREIEELQSNCDMGFFHGLCLQMFSLLLTTHSLIRIEVFESSIVAILVVSAVCSVSCFVICWIYDNYWRCREIRIESFDYDYSNCSNNHIIEKHYEYLKSIKETVYFRYSMRKILFAASFIIYLLFFFRIPE